MNEETYNDMVNFINKFVDEFSSEGTVSHDTFNVAVKLKYRIIADSDLHEDEIKSDISCENCRFNKPKTYHDQMWCRDCRQKHHFERINS